jgi:hypothetical protein
VDDVEVDGLVELVVDRAVVLEVDVGTVEVVPEDAHV